MEQFGLYVLISVLLIVIIGLLIERHRSHKAFIEDKEYHRFLSDVLDNLPFPIMVKNVEKHFSYSYWNKESELQSGIRSEDAIGHTDFDIYGEERGKYYRAIDEEMVRVGEVYRAEEHYKTSDGVDHDTIVAKAVLQGGKSGRWLLVARWEITQMKQCEREMMMAKEQLEEANRKQNLALNSIDFGLVYLDKNYKVQWEVTHNIKEVFPNRCYTPGKICYETCGLGSEPCQYCAFKEAMEQGRVVKHTIRVEDIDLEVTGTPVYADGEGSEIVGGLLRLENISEKVKTSQLLEEARDKAEESNRLKSAFLANMSHEIRTPLNAIVGFSDMICQVDTLEEKEEYIKIITSNNELLLQLIDDILDLSKIEAGTMDFTFAPTDVNEMMSGVCQQMEQKNLSEEVEILFVERQEQCVIETDRIRVSQVVINFISNAMKFTSKGTISVGYRLSADQNEIYFYVKDTGIGISADQLERVFERFVKLNSFAKGTGLGLSICRVIVERLGGCIGVESQVGEGSCFWFRIPVILVPYVPLHEDVD